MSQSDLDMNARTPTLVGNEISNDNENMFIPQSNIIEFDLSPRKSVDVLNFNKQNEIDLEKEEKEENEIDMENDF